MQRSVACRPLVSRGSRVHACDVVTDKARVAAAEEVLVVAHRVDDVLRRLVNLAADLTRAPIGMLNVVEGHRQVVVVHCGLPEALVSEAGPVLESLEYSICQHAVATGRPLIVGDARLDPVLRSNRAVTDLGAVAYAGVPLITESQHAVGTLCVVDLVARDWLDDQLAQLAHLADIAADELGL